MSSARNIRRWKAALSARDAVGRAPFIRFLSAESDRSVRDDLDSAILRHVITTGCAVVQRGPGGEVELYSARDVYRPGSLTWPEVLATAERHCSELKAESAAVRRDMTLAWMMLAKAAFLDANPGLLPLAYSPVSDFKRLPSEAQRAYLLQRGG